MLEGDWDYIIVGAGTAGCVLANRLSADPRTRVLLIESGGGNRNPWIRIPVGYFKTIGDPRYDWRHQTEPEPNLHGRRLDWPRGRGLGGSSAINGLIYVRGQPEDYDAWGRVAPGWSFAECLPAFKRAERQQRGAGPYHGADGPVGVSDTRAGFAITDRFVAAAKSFGLPFNPDCNAESQEGVGHYQTTTWNGLRVSNAHAYLDPIRRRPNLRVLTEARVLRIEIEQHRACGVCLRLGAEEHRINCSGEVLLAAGAIGSPHLLMLSGVGPAEEIAKFGISPVLDSVAVGKRLQDHLKTHNSYRVRIPTLNQQLGSITGRVRMGLQFAVFRSGPLTMGAAPVFAFLRSAPDIERPDIQFHVLPWSSDDPTKGFHDFPGFTVSICPTRPESRGEIVLKSPDPMDAPAIHANYLSTENDCWCIVAGVRRAREICRHPPLSDLIEEEVCPGAELAEADDEALLDAIKMQVTTIYHPCGTVAMGDGAPLDERCRMRGIDRLRIVDASVMPSIVSGNINAAVNMIAERASDMIIADAR